MKVLIATGLYAPDIGGPATYTAFLERHLPAQGFDVSVVPFSAVRRYPRIIRHFIYAWKLFTTARDAEIIYALDAVSVGVPALVVSTLLRKPLYLRVPGDYAWEQGQQRFGLTDTLDEYLVKGSSSMAVKILAWMQYIVARKAQRIVTPSEYLKQVVHQWGIDTKKIRMIPSAYHPVVIPESRDDLRARFKYEGFVVLTAARLVPWKGVKKLIDAVAVVRGKGILISLDIVGDGVERDNLERHVREKHAEEYVHFRGREEKETLVRRVKAADVFVLNTSYEGLSHQLIEVMDIGTPLITTPVGGNVELITHEEEGLLVPVDHMEELIEGLERLRTDMALRIKLVEGAKKRVLDFKEEKVLEEVIILFQ